MCESAKKSAPDVMCGKLLPSAYADAPLWQLRHSVDTAFEPTVAPSGRW